MPFPSWVSISVVLIVAFWVAFGIQNFVILPVQQMFLPDIMFPAISLVHGVRVIAAWHFGWASVLLLAPNVVIFALVLHAGLTTALFYEPITFFTLSFIILASAPASFFILRWAFQKDTSDNPFEWRLIMVAGILSAFINVMAQAALYPPALSLTEAILAMIALAGTMVLGLFVTLLLLLFLSRVIGR